MRLIWLPIVLLTAACAAPEHRPAVDDRDRYMSGYATTGPVEAKEFVYDDRDAAVRFPPPGEPRTFTRLEAEAMRENAWPEAGAAGLSDDAYEAGYGGAGDDYWENDYGGSGRLPRPGRPRPPVVRPPVKPKPPVAKPPVVKPNPLAPEQPAPGPSSRREATSAPEKPERSRDATKAPRSGRK